MARGVRKERVYTGKALKVYEKVKKLEAELKVAKEELKTAYKEQVKTEKAAAVKAKKEAEAAAKREKEELKEKLLKAIEESGKTPDEVLQLLKSSAKDTENVSVEDEQ